MLKEPILVRTKNSKQVLSWGNCGSGDRMGHPSRSGSSNLHVKVSLGEILNPKLPLMHLLECESMSVWCK